MEEQGIGERSVADPLKNVEFQCSRTFLGALENKNCKAVSISLFMFVRL
jgi:hypothetical protein